MKSNLKLYVWQGVLTDYTDGVMFALAKDVDQARAEIIKKAKKNDCSKYYSLKTIESELQLVEPTEYEKPVGFYLWGGA